MNENFNGYVLDEYLLCMSSPLVTKLQVSIVSQEPVLFNCSIEENIAYGYDGKATGSEIENVAVSFYSWANHLFKCYKLLTKAFLLK